MKTGRALALALFMSLLASVAPGKGKSDSMKRIIEHHLVGKHDFGMEDLPKIKNFIEPKLDEEHEIYDLPAPRGVADYFHYRAILNTVTQQYWLIRTGGVAGVFEAFGPQNVGNIK